MKDLLGFIVLTGPLWLFCILLLASVWVTAILKRRVRGRISRLAILIFLSVCLVLFADEIIGRIYLAYLCETKAGVKVYRTVELPEQFWDENSKPRFIKGIGALDTAMLAEYDTVLTLSKYQSFIPIKEFKFRYIEKRQGEVLGEITSFHYLGGWVTRNFSPAPGAGASCDMPEVQNSRNIVLSIFRPSVNEQK